MRIHLYIILTLMALLVSCSSIEKKDAGFRVSAADAIKYAKMTQAEIIKGNVESIHQGETDGLAFFAPDTFKRAKYYFEKMPKNKKGGKNRADIIRKTELVNKYLAESYALKETLSVELEGVLEVNTFLQKLNAHKTNRKEFDKFQRRMADMVEDFEEKRTQEAFKDRSTLLNDMENLEARATIAIVLGPAQKIFVDMDDRKLDDEAPQSLQEAHDIYDTSVASIWANCRDQDNLDRVRASSIFWATRARNISEETLRLRKHKKDSFELIVLEEERRLYNIGKAFNAVDFRDLTLNDHAASLAKVAENHVNVPAESIESAPESVIHKVPELTQNLSEPPTSTLSESKE